MGLPFLCACKMLAEFCMMRLITKEKIGGLKMRLNIIGNGFDLYHGLPCSYYYFGCFLAKHHHSFYEEMSQMFNFPCYKPVGYEEIEIFVDQIFWQTFEERLGELDSIWMEEKLLDDLGLECSDPVDIEIPEEANAEKIKEKFCDWISTTVNTYENYQIIKRKIKGEKVKFNMDDYFINFNYTQTLQEIYKIPDSRVYHIHGKCIMGEESNLVIGHGNYKAIQRLDEKIEEIESDTYYLQEQSVRNRLNEYKCERIILSELRKNVGSILFDLRTKLDTNAPNVEEIWIWGFSFGQVDKPYIKFLRERYPNAKWKISYYNIHEKNTRREFADEIGLSEKEVEYFELNNPNDNNIRKQMVLYNDIEEF